MLITLYNAVKWCDMSYRTAAPMVATSFTKFKSHKFQFPPEPGRQAGRSLTDRCYWDWEYWIQSLENVCVGGWCRGGGGWCWDLMMRPLTSYSGRLLVVRLYKTVGIRRTLTDPHYLLCCGQLAGWWLAPVFPLRTELTLTLWLSDTASTPTYTHRLKHSHRTLNLR